MFRSRNHGKRISHVEFAEQIQMKFKTGNFKFRRSRAEFQIERAKFIFITDTESLHRAMRDVQQRREICVVAIGEQQTVARNQIDEAFELKLDCRQILKNIGMIEFDVVDDRDFRQVMNELAALIKKRGVVFVSFDDKPFAIRKARALFQILWNSANQKTGIQSVVFKNPGEQ